MLPTTNDRAGVMAFTLPRLLWLQAESTCSSRHVSLATVQRTIARVAPCTVRRLAPARQPHVPSRLLPPAVAPDGVGVEDGLVSREQPALDEPGGRVYAAVQVRDVLAEAGELGPPCAPRRPPLR